ncbi:MAG: Holliday junction resolvase-like protein, partial [Dehalococcoidia bacterium]
MEYALLAVIFLLIAVIIVLLFRLRKTPAADVDQLAEKLRFALASADSVKEIQRILESLPRDVLKSITSSEAVRAGKLNELLATLELTHYDRLFYLGGNPVDFVGIKYGQGIDFIEVKTGKSALSPDEKELRDLIECKMVNYVPLTVKRIGIAEEVETGEGE